MQSLLRTGTLYLNVCGMVVYIFTHHMLKSNGALNILYISHNLANAHSQYEAIYHHMTELMHQQIFLSPEALQVFYCEGSIDKRN